MKKKFILVGVILGVCILITASVLLLTKTSVVASPDTILEECTTLQYNSENAINLVFFAEKQTAQEYSDYLFQYKPFSETKDRFN
ncbi:MAG: hypothetical protein KC506_02610, partial [Nanoarchaeota archaeon]|nr:hypothetical protein [Nanoarchaeota archaeon]